MKLNVYCFSYIFGDLLETFSDAEQPELRHNSCNCYEMSSDIEGVKLDVTILEAKLEQHSNLISQMQDKLTKQCSELDSKQSKRHDFPVCRDIHDDVQVTHADLNLQQQQSTSSSLLENNVNPPFCKANEALCLPPTEDYRINNGPGSLISKNSHFESGGESFPTNLNTVANCFQTTTQNSFEDQLKDYHKKQKLLFDRGNQKKVDAQLYGKQRLLFKCSGQHNNAANSYRSTRNQHLFKLFNTSNPKMSRKNVPVTARSPKTKNHYDQHFYQAPRNHRTSEWLDYLELVRKVTHSFPPQNHFRQRNYKTPPY